MNNIFRFIQALCRGHLTRLNVRLRVQHIKATIIQRNVRGWLARLRFRRCIRGIVLLQAHIRRRQARKIFKSLKIEARSVDHQKKLNLGLENKIISLQQQIGKIVICIILKRYLRSYTWLFVKKKNIYICDYCMLISNIYTCK